MKQLNYQTLQDLNYDGYLLNEAPERVLQFGEGSLFQTGNLLYQPLLKCIQRL